MAEKKKRSKKGTGEAAYWTPSKTQEQEDSWGKSHKLWLATELRDQAFSKVNPEYKNAMEAVSKSNSAFIGDGSDDDFWEKYSTHRENQLHLEDMATRMHKENGVPFSDFESMAERKGAEIIKQLKPHGMRSWWGMRGNGEWNFKETSPGTYEPAGDLLKPKEELEGSKKYGPVTKSISDNSVANAKTHISAQQFPVFQQPSLFD